jgi:hypothetical protein
MKRLLPLLLVLGVMIGMFGQGVAFAGVPSATATTATSHMGSNCTEKMQKQQPSGNPCQHLTLACVAAMGGASTFALPEAAAILAKARIFAMRAFWPATKVLVGSDLAPDSPPPNLLG